MFGILTRFLIVALAVAGLSVSVLGIAYADLECGQIDRSTGQCLIWVNVPGQPGNPGDGGHGGPKDTGSGSACFWDGTDQGIQNPPPGPVPCSAPSGYWSNGYNCYISPVTPPPPAGDPGWQGHEPGDGAVYNCYQPQTGLLITLWAQNQPPNSGAGPTPAQVAQLAIESMHLSAIEIGIAPEPGPDSVGLVGMPVWMWAKNPTATTVGPVTASASAGGITITATATLFRTTWDMGDGTEVVCRTAGTPYDASFGQKQSPDCGHTYTTTSASEPGGDYTVSATSDWVITWAGAGQTGTIRLNGLIRTTQITIGEAQVLVN